MVDSSTAQPSLVLWVTANDRPGVIAQVCASLTEAGSNITRLQQTVQASQLIMRLELACATDVALSDLQHNVIALCQRPPITHWRCHDLTQPHRLALWVSKPLHALYDLLQRQATGRLQADVVLVLSNHLDAEPVAASFGCTFHHVPITPENKPRQEALMLEHCQAARVDTIVLARYMQIVGPEVVQAYPNRIINIHHSMLPAFAGAKPYHRAWERGVKCIGATSHYVTEGLDEGPIITQDVLPITHQASVEALIERGKDAECRALHRALAHHVAHKVWVDGQRTIVFD